MLTLSILPERFAVCRLNPDAPVPAWATPGTFFSVTRTAGELSIVCAEENVPETSEVCCERGWRALKIEGPFDFTAVGVLAAVAVPLAEAGIGILAIATYDTDYVLVKKSHLRMAVAALSRQGHTVEQGCRGAEEQG